MKTVQNQWRRVFGHWSRRISMGVRGRVARVNRREGRPGQPGRRRPYEQRQVRWAGRASPSWAKGACCVAIYLGSQLAHGEKRRGVLNVETLGTRGVRRAEEAPSGGGDHRESDGHMQAAKEQCVQCAVTA